MNGKQAAQSARGQHSLMRGLRTDFDGWVFLPGSVQSHPLLVAQHKGPMWQAARQLVMLQRKAEKKASCLALFALHQALG